MRTEKEIKDRLKEYQRLLSETKSDLQYWEGERDKAISACKCVNKANAKIDLCKRSIDDHKGTISDLNWVLGH